MLLHKKGDSLKPSNYRLITCLNLYKILTSCLLKRFNLHVERDGLYDPQQQGVCRNQRGCHENCQRTDSPGKNGPAGPFMLS